MDYRFPLYLCQLRYTHRCKSYVYINKAEDLHQGCTYLDITQEEVDKVVKFVHPRHHADNTEYELAELAFINSAVLVKFDLLLNLLPRCGGHIKKLVTQCCDKLNIILYLFKRQYLREQFIEK